MGTFKTISQILISSIVFFFLAAQITTVVLPVEWYYWPFTNYPMYSAPHFEGDVATPSTTIIGIQPGNIEETTTPKDFGLSVFQHEWWFIPSLLKNEDPQKVQSFINHLQNSRTIPFQELRIESRGYIISRAGYSPAPVKVLKVIALNGPQESSP
ncbi:MAG: hypothetical protein ACPGYT_11360 [Nitrospirales bacterium]